MKRRLSLLAVAASLCVCLSFALHAADAPAPKAGHPREAIFAEPFIDTDEWRDKPVRHRYVHGGFKGTETLFSMYFPPKEQYQGRFFQPVGAVSGNENAQAAITGDNTTIGFAIASGGYLVESNLGAKSMYDSAGLSMFRATAAVAEYSRTLAAEMYGPHRAHGYTYGGSGGGFKTMAAAENTTGVFDGFVPFVIGSPVYNPNVFSVQAYAVRVIGDKWHDVVDAIDPGGSGKPCATLNKEECAAYTEATRFGMPPRIWFTRDRMGYGPLGVLIDAIVARDPGYFEDFWKVPGYEGANPPESLRKAHIKEHKTTISKIVMSDEARSLGLPVPMAANGTNVIPAAFQFANMPKGDLKGATLTVKSGVATGNKLSISGVAGDLITVATGNAAAFKAVNAIKTGDEVEIDNSIYLAVQTYHRHQVHEPEFFAWEQFRGPDGKPIYPQRKLDRDNGQSGKFAGKMIVIESMVDEYAYPWQAAWYNGQVKKVLGDKIDDQFRLWFTDNAMHGGPGGRSADRAHIVAYTNELQQALRDVSAWAEKGTKPPANTSYKVVEAQIVLPPTAKERKGVQPVVGLTANGKVRADVKVGEAVTFVGTVDAPPTTGKVVEAKWDFEGTGDYPVPGEVKLTDAAGEHATVSTTYTFTKPGTYFPVLQAASQRTADGTPYARIPNLARVRVVVR